MLSFDRYPEKKESTKRSDKMNDTLKISTSELVMSAVFFLQQKNGVTASDITKFICDKRKCAMANLKEKVKRTLEKATKRGFLSKDKALYKTKTGYEKSIEEDLKALKEAKESESNERLEKFENSVDDELKPSLSVDKELLKEILHENKSSQEHLRFTEFKETENFSPNANEGNTSDNRTPCNHHQIDEDDNEDFLDEDDEEDDIDFFEDDDDATVHYTRPDSKVYRQEAAKKRSSSNKRKDKRKKMKLGKKVKQKKKNSKRKSAARNRNKKHRKGKHHNHDEEEKEDDEEIAVQKAFGGEKALSAQKEEENETIQPGVEKGRKGTGDNKGQLQNKVISNEPPKNECKQKTEENEKKNVSKGNECGKNKNAGSSKNKFSERSLSVDKKFKRKRSSSLFRPRKKKVNYKVQPGKRERFD